MSIWVPLEHFPGKWFKIHELNLPVRISEDHNPKQTAVWPEIYVLNFPSSAGTWVGLEGWTVLKPRLREVTWCLKENKKDYDIERAAMNQADVGPPCYDDVISSTRYPVLRSSVSSQHGQDVDDTAGNEARWALKFVDFTPHLSNNASRRKAVPIQ